MIKLTILVTRNPTISEPEFRDYWLNHHAPFLLGLKEFRAHARRYVQQHPIDPQPLNIPIASFDGIAELWYDSVEELNQALSLDIYRTIIAEDEKKFSDRDKMVMIVTEEKPVI